MNDWITEIRQSLTLGRRGLLLLVDRAALENLGILVRSLLVDHPNLEVFIDPTEFAQVPDGSVIVYVPEREHAAWLNFNRPLFARKALKVVLFCKKKVTQELARKAPDFYDWIAQRLDCPEAVPLHAVFGIQQALRCRAQGMVFEHGCFKDEDEGLERFVRVFRRALPARTIRLLDPQMPYEDLVAEIKAAGRAWLGCTAISMWHEQRFRWALAEANRKTRAILIHPIGINVAPFWRIRYSIDKNLTSLVDALRNAGAKHPGRLLATTGLEDGLAESLIDLLARGYSEEKLLAEMLRQPDPGAGLAEISLRAGIEYETVQGRDLMNPWVQRYLGKRTALHRLFPGKQPRIALETPNRKDWPIERKSSPLDAGPRIEARLCQRPSTAEQWLGLSKLAFDYGDFDAARVWADRSIEKQPSSAAHLMYGLAGLSSIDAYVRNDHPGYLLGYVRNGIPMLSTANTKKIMATPNLRERRRTALDWLELAEKNLDADVPPEDVMTLYSILAQLYQEFGLPDAGWMLERAAMMVDQPTSRVRDIIRVGNLLWRRGDRLRAERTLRSVFDKPILDEERSRIQLWLALLAFEAKRFDEASALAMMLADNAQMRNDWDQIEQCSLVQLRIQLQLEHGEARQSLAFADDTLARRPEWLIEQDLLGKGPPLIAFVAYALNRCGRPVDAEVLLRWFFGLPMMPNVETCFQGLALRPVLLELVQNTHWRGEVTIEELNKLWDDLILALRSQGRHAEADELQRGGQPYRS